MRAHPTRFPFLRLWSGSPYRPILWIRIANAHKPEKCHIVPALVDTGADRSAASKKLCHELGHVFDAGNPEGETSGIGRGMIRSFSHDSELVPLRTRKDGLPGEDAAFEPLRLRLEFLDQSLPFVLLGQADFLSLFEYRQSETEAWFELAPI